MGINFSGNSKNIFNNPNQIKVKGGGAIDLNNLQGVKTNNSIFSYLNKIGITMKFHF